MALETLPDLALSAASAANIQPPQQHLLTQQQCACM
jgi:hypothetical protein